ncbi:hypothetical protein Tco_0877427 [Tanacetum coccineum]|uniref:MAK10-like protein n=1 Tax=Tanacetum coccineum TaxID=301880 RepID=A0ABQ5BXS1_9ASTR
MENENPIRTLGDYSRPSREGYQNTIELSYGNNVGQSLFEAWTHFKDLLQKVPHHGSDLWLQIQIFYDHVSFHLKSEIDSAAGGKLRDKNAKESWEIIKNLALYDHEGWNDSRDFAKPAEKKKGVEGCEVAEGNVMELNKLDALEPIESNKEEEMEEGTMEGQLRV